MRVALLTNFIPPYRLRFFEALAREAGELRVFVSTRMEGNRDWNADWGSLDVVVQKTLTLHKTWRAEGFSERQEVHIPYDTILQLRRYKPDLIISGELSARSLQAMLYARAAIAPVVIWATLSDHLEAQRGVVKRRARGWLLRSAQRVIVNGESGARYVRRFGVPDDKLIRMPYVTDMTSLLALPLERADHAQHELLYVGALSERKGVHLLMDAANLWAASHPDRTLALTLVGNGPLRERLEKQPCEPNLGVTWMDHVAYKDLPAIYGSKGILIFPTLGDEWGLVVNEALAAGMPVLGSLQSQAVEELVRDGINGWTMSSPDVRVIAGAIDRALDTTIPALNAMRVAARESVRLLTPDVVANRLMSELQA